MRSTLILGLILASATLAAQQPAATQPPPAWLAGQWTGTDRGDTFEEFWTTPGGDTMLGMSRTLGKSGKTMFYMYLRIEPGPDGALYFTVQRRGGTPAAFKAKEITADRAVFENPQNEYPKRITYQRGADAVTVRIEGDPGEKPEEFRLTRMKK